MTIDSFAEAMKTSFPILVDLLTRRYRDRQLTEEIVWDCLTKAFEVWQGDPQYFQHHDLSRWVSNRANWRILDALRQRSRFSSLSEERADEEGTAPPLVAPSEDSEVISEKDREMVYSGIQRLEAAERYLLESYYYDGRTDQEIGSELFGESGTALGRGLRAFRLRKKARAQLREALLLEGIDPADFSPHVHQAI